MGLGASAGGIEALVALLERLPSAPGMAFLVAVHLDPDQASHLVEVLGRACPFPVLEASQGLGVRIDHVYVITPNSYLSLVQGTLRVTPRGERRGPHLPIDHLFRSLASEQQARAIGVVLSGTGSDGTLGLCEIKAMGGITFAQDDQSARHRGMPRHAVDAGCVDFVLPPAGIAQRLVEIASHSYLAPPEAQAEPPPAEDDAGFRRILQIVHKVFGVDFTHYRDTTIKRRIQRRMAVHDHGSLERYLERLEGNAGEVEALYRDLLINVTSFFRDPGLFEGLKQVVYPQIIAGKEPGTSLRVWVAGCSTGQEAYSIAMSLVEFFDDKPMRLPIQVFATDLSDPTALERARAGTYPETIEGEVSPERLRRFFRKEDHVYRVQKSIRDMCVFARQNLTADPPFSHLDLVSCRNVLIYMAPALQRRVLPTFHYALNVPGYLVLGSAESVGDSSDLFEQVDRANRIYIKKAASRRPSFAFSTDDFRMRVAEPQRRPAASAPSTLEYQREVDRLLLGRFAPPGVLVNEHFDVLQYRGRTSRYLEAPPGEPTSNVLKQAREGLFLDLRSALTEASAGEGPVRRASRVILDETSHPVEIEVTPVSPPGTRQPCLLVLFHDRDTEAAPRVQQDPRESRSRAAGAASEEELVQLRRELAATKEYMQSLIEQQDAANEELRSAHEEVLSSNEELQSTNEELETAKEELQSANEELTTVNEQLQHRNQEVTQVSNDMINLLASTTIPVVMVGSDLRIRRFTAPARKAMNLLPQDIGRPIADMTSNLAPDLEDRLAEVIETMQPMEREVQDREGRWYSMRLHPYRTADNRIDGAVVVLVDVDQAKRTQEALEQQAAQLRRQQTLIELSQDAIIVRDDAGRVVTWNRGAEVMYGWTAKEAAGQPFHDLVQSGDPATVLAMNAALEKAGEWEGELRQVRRDGRELMIHSRQVRMPDEGGFDAAILEINRDITEKRRHETALVQADRQKDEFLATLAHELRNPLGAIRNATELLGMGLHDPAVLEQARTTLQRQVGGLGQIVDDLIDVTGIVRGKVKLRPQHVDLNRLVAAAVEACRPAIDASRHRLTVSPASVPIRVHVDPVRITQVLVNVLSNAAKFTDPGGEIRIECGLESRTDPAYQGEPYALVRVRDNGIGIAPDMLSRVFDMFVQADRSLARSRGGVGVGLTLARRLVELQGGTVQALSDGLGKGSEFVIRLPVDAAPPAAEERAEPAVDGPRRSVLIVDDKPDYVRTLELLLSQHGHTIHIAFTGEDALRVADEVRPEFVLLDIGLPGMDGYTVAERMRANPRLKGTVLIAQSGWGQEEDRRRSSEAGFDLHLVKPLDIQVLKRIFAEGARRTPSSE